VQCIPEPLSPNIGLAWNVGRVAVLAPTILDDVLVTYDLIGMRTACCNGIVDFVWPAVPTS